jgi:hypothetical protein
VTPPLEQQLAKARLFVSRPSPQAPRVVRVAGPNGFTWHVQRDGQTLSSHPNAYAATAALNALKAGAK